MTGGLYHRLFQPLSRRSGGANQRRPDDLSEKSRWSGHPRFAATPNLKGKLRGRSQRQSTSAGSANKLVADVQDSDRGSSTEARSRCTLVS